MNLSRVATPSLRLVSRALQQQQACMYSSSDKGKVHPGYIKIREKYKHFQVDDGVPVHLKGGPMDKFLYYFTIAGCVVGTFMTFEYFYSAAFPKKN